MGDKLTENLVAILRAPPRKYGNEPVTLDGHKFDSKWEMQRYLELRNQVTAGAITDLKLQQPFGLDVWTPSGPVRIGAYLADFTFWRVDVFVIEDTKSPATRREKLYLWKKAHLEAQYGFKIVEIVKIKRTKKT